MDYVNFALKVERDLTIIASFENQYVKDKMHLSNKDKEDTSSILQNVDDHHHA